MTRLRQDLDEFLFAQRPAATLGVFRIAFGLIVISWCILIGPDLRSWYGESGFFNLAAMRTWGSGNLGLDLLALRTWTTSMFHHPMFADVTDFSITIGAYVLLLLSAVCLTVGYKTRAASILVWLLLTSFHHRDMIILNGGDTLQRNLAFLIMFTDAGVALSVDRLVRIARGQERAETVPMTEMWPIRLIQIQISLVYLSAVFSKIMGPEWRDGTAFWYAMQLTDLRRFSLFGMEYRPLFYTMASYGTMAVEFSLGAFLWVPRLRRYVITAGILLHGGIEWVMTVPLFSFTMITSYIVFAHTSSVTVAAQWIRKKVSANTLSVARPPRVAFELVRALDGLKLIEFDEGHAGPADEAAVRRILWRLPLTWALLLIPPLLVLTILPVRWLLIPVDVVWPIAFICGTMVLSRRLVAVGLFTGEIGMPEAEPD